MLFYQYFLKNTNVWRPLVLTGGSKARMARKAKLHRGGTYLERT